MNLIFLSLILFESWTIFALPANRGRQLAEESGIPEKKPRPSCFFSKLRKTEAETIERPVKSTVSLDCSNSFIKISDLFHYPLNRATKESNASALLICRGTGECDLDFYNPEVIEKWKDVVICEQHADELLRKWGDGKTYLHKHVWRTRKDNKRVECCSMPEGLLVEHQFGVTSRLRPVTMQQANAVMKISHILIHPGAPACHLHRQMFDQIARVVSFPGRPVDDIYADDDMDVCPNDPEVTFPPENHDTPAINSLQQFANIVGVDIPSSRKPYSELRERTKQKKAVAVRKLIDSVIGIVAPGNKEDFKKRVSENKVQSWTFGSSDTLNKILLEITGHFLAAENRQSKLTVLSLVANVVPHSTIEKYIPGLSRYFYGEARKFARRNRDVKTPPKQLERYNRTAVETFVEFITSPTIMLGLPYGVKKVKLSDGTKLEIPNSIRQQSSSEIYEMYKNFLKDTDQTDLMLSKSSVYEILDVCAATKREATTCVDYFVANGMEAFDELHKLVDEWINNDPAQLKSLKQLKNKLFEAAQYLRTDYRLHVKMFSRVADHCATYALSDPNDNRMSASCSTGKLKHKHNIKCDRCESVDSTLFEIKRYAEELWSEAKEEYENAGTILKNNQLTKLEEDVEQVDKCIHQVLEMKKHLLRAAVTNEEREKIIGSLRDNESLITLDFAQKYLPKWHREKQSDYFGKKGISYHVAHVTARIGDNYTQHTFVHIYEGEVQQNSALVVLTLSHIAKELKTAGITHVSLRSDNAGSYHSASTIASIHWLMEDTGIIFKSYSFSEAQNGKSSSDRDAGRVKQKAGRYVANGGDITTSNEFFEALKTGIPLNGVSIHHGSVTVTDSGEASWPGISSLNYFTIEEKGIRGHKYHGMGAGQFVKSASLKSLKGTHQFEGAGYLASDITSVDVEREAVRNGLETKFWYRSSCSKAAKCDISTCINEEDDLSPEIDELGNAEVGKLNALYACPEPGCSATFLKHANLEKHIFRGKHKTSPERLTLRDSALKFFVRGLEEVAQTKPYPAIGNAIKIMQETTAVTTLQPGWALPKKQTRKPFGPDQKKFLIECFEEGLLKKRLNPSTIAKRMSTATNPDGTKRFSVEERMEMRQIAGFLSRECKKRRDPATRPKRSENQEEDKNDKEYISSDEQHEDAQWIEFLKDEATWTTMDELLTAIYENPEALFID